MAIHADIVVVNRGQQRTVAYAVRKDGSRPAEEFIDQVMDQRSRARLFALIAKLCATGRIVNDEQFKKEEDETWGLKPTSQVRIACFQDGRFWFLTHGFVKKRAKWPRSELERAEEIRHEHLARCGKSVEEQTEEQGE